MNKNDYPKDHPDCILFYGEKNAENKWYTLNKGKEKIWDAQKVTHFWTRLRKEKMAKEDYNFRGFIFPEFGEEHFWVKETKKVFTKDVIFREAIFSDKADFDSVAFSGEADFRSAAFSSRADFWNGIFSGEAYFGEATFSDEAYFYRAIFGWWADFDSATFSGKAYFKSVIFSGKANFKSATFRFADFKSVTFRLADFWNATFSDDAYFDSATFSRWANFKSATFSRWVNFKSAIFRFADFKSTAFRFADFKSATFSEWADFYNATFSGEIDFKSTIFKNVAYFKSTTFSDQANFLITIFNNELFFEDIYCIDAANLQFNNTKFPKEHPAHFKNIRFVPTAEIVPSKSEGETKKNKVKQIPVVAFNRVIFTSQIIFLSCDFTYMQFTDCELTQATIGNCDFPRKQKMFHMPIGSNRILLGNEVFTESVYKQVKEQNESEIKETQEVIDNINENKKEHEPKIKPEPPLKIKNKQELKYEHYNMMAVTYRQLKTNRANNKDWANAGDAYRSEMIMRRKAIVHEIVLHIKPFLLVNLLIIWLHDILSGFQQSISRPLLWLCAVWFGFGWGYYYFDDYSMGGGLKESAKAILILSGSLNKEDPLFGYMVLERVIGVILLTFFVLATRARLKQ